VTNYLRHPGLVPGSARLQLMDKKLEANPRRRGGFRHRPVLSAAAGGVEGAGMTFTDIKALQTAAEVSA